MKRTQKPKESESWDHGPESEVPIPLARLAEILGLSRITMWRWSQLGWVRTVNIAGRPFVLPAEIRRFSSRAAAGEFSREPAGAAKRRTQR